MAKKPGCLRFECVWHGTVLDINAPMCDYAFLHSVHTIPDDPPCRGCEGGEGCLRFKEGDRFQAAEAYRAPGGKIYTRMKTVRRDKPSAGRIERFKANAQRGQTTCTQPKKERPSDATMMAAWNAGMDDEEMARHGNTSIFYVKEWRRAHGIKRSPHPDKTPVDDSLVLELHDKGIPDCKIAKMLGISITSARNHRAAVEAERNLRRANERAEDESN